MQILKNISGKTYLNRKLVVTLLSKSPCICLSGIEGLLLRSPIIMVLGKEDISRIKMPASCIFSSSQLLIWDFKFAEKRKVFHAFNLYHKCIWIATFFGKKKAETYARNIFCLNLRLYVYKQRRQVQEPIYINRIDLFTAKIHRVAINKIWLRTYIWSVSKLLQLEVLYH